MVIIITNQPAIAKGIISEKKFIQDINKHAEYIFFTYKTIDNYINHCWYDMSEDELSFFNVFEPGITYSWYKGNIYPDDMDKNILRKDHMICLFNNSAQGIDEHMHEIEELNGLY